MADKKAIGKLVLAGVGGLVVGAAVAGGIAAAVVAGKKKKAADVGTWKTLADKNFKSAGDLVLNSAAGGITPDHMKAACAALKATAFSIDAKGVVAKIYFKTPASDDEVAEPGAVIGTEA